VRVVPPIASGRSGWGAKIFGMTLPCEEPVKKNGLLQKPSEMSLEGEAELFSRSKRKKE
jgi:hypothetical protein